MTKAGLRGTLNVLANVSRYKTQSKYQKIYQIPI